MELYRILTKDAGEYYVVGPSIDKAIENLQSILMRAGYGTQHRTAVVSVYVVSKEIALFADRPNPTDTNRLVLPDSCI